jgi:asparagine synthase (glutamine-hydrolysing)
VSAIAAIAAAPNERIDEAHFARWAPTISDRGPDGFGMWSCAHAALAHALLQAYPDDPVVAQPFTLDGTIIVSANARIDAREALHVELAAAGHAPTANASDSELILRAYLAWGTDCPEHLLGEYAFVLWDERHRLLFAARDRFGARPLYWARTGSAMLVSNHANALFRHPSVDRTPNDETIAAFLVSNDFGAPDATAFRGIGRVPAAHRLVWQRGQMSLGRYWSVPVEDPLRLKKREDYPRLLWETVRTAVADASRGGPVGVLLSGGLDSPMLAAALQQTASAGKVSGHTSIWRELMPDLERPYAEEVAASLGIPWLGTPFDEREAFEGSAQVQLATPFPDGSPFSIDTHDLLADVGQRARVAFTGLGPDALLRGEPLVPRLFAGPGRMAAAAGAISYVVRLQKRPPLGVRPWISARRAHRSPKPDWLPEELFKLAGEAAAVSEQRPTIHPYRPSAYRLTASTYWENYLEWYCGTAHAGQTLVAHPFLDLRVVRLALRLPAIPWAWDKLAQRLAVKGHLPDGVAKRRKTPLVQDRVAAYVRKHGLGWLRDQKPGLDVREYYHGAAFAQLADAYARKPDWIHIRPICLDRFLSAWWEQKGIE